MEHRFLGKTGLRVSQFGFGTMTFGGEADAKESEAIFNRCLEAGINFFDCANVYQQGESERILGKLAKPHRDQLVISSKAYFPAGEGPNDRGASRYHIVNSVEGSLERLDTDRIDVFFVHRFDEVTDLEETLRTVDDLVSAGKILYLGLSNFAAWQVEKALGIAALRSYLPPVVIQPMYNLLKRQAEVEILPMAAAENLGVVTFSPLAGGILSGKYSGTNKPEEGRLLTNKMYQTRYGEKWMYEAAGELARIGREWGHSPVALAIGWVASHPAVTAPLIGARSVDQLEGALEAASVDMTEELRSELSSLTPAPPPPTDRNEERSKNNYGSR